MSGMLQYKSITGAVKDVDSKNRVITGYLSKTEVVDNHNDIMAKGAFTKTLNENRDSIFFLNQHNFAQPHGKFSVLKEDDYGLYFESQPLIKGVSYSDDALKLYEAGILNEHSVGYITQKSKQIENDTRVITEVKLYEGSNVTMAANSGATFLGFKDMSQKDIDLKVKKIITFLRNGDITDDGFKLLEISLKDLQAASFELGKKALNGGEPLSGTYVDIEPSIKIINEFINKF